MVSDHRVEASRPGGARRSRRPGSAGVGRSVAQGWAPGRQVSSVRTTIFEKGPGAPDRQLEAGKQVTKEETVTRAPENSPLAGAELYRL